MTPDEEFILIKIDAKNAMKYLKGIMGDYGRHQWETERVEKYIERLEQKVKESEDK